jgi:hypothetical protein
MLDGKAKRDGARSLSLKVPAFIRLNCRDFRGMCELRMVSLILRTAPVGDGAVDRTSHMR